MTSLKIVIFLVGVAIVRNGIANDPPVRREQIAAWVDAAEKLEADGSTQNAIFVYQRVLKANPQHPTVLSKVGKLHYQLKDFAEAAEHFARAAQLEPDHAGHHNDAGCAHRKAKQYGQSLEHLQRAVELDPKFLRYANNLATLYVDMGDDAKAIKALDHAHRNQAVIHFNMAYLYSERKRDEEAMIHLDAALLHDPNLSRAIHLRDHLTRRYPNGFEGTQRNSAEAVGRPTSGATKDIAN